MKKTVVCTDEKYGFTYGNKYAVLAEIGNCYLLVNDYGRRTNAFRWNFKEASEYQKEKEERGKFEKMYYDKEINVLMNSGICRFQLTLDEGFYVNVKMMEGILDTRKMIKIVAKELSRIPEFTVFKRTNPYRFIEETDSVNIEWAKPIVGSPNKYIIHSSQLFKYSANSGILSFRAFAADIMDYAIFKDYGNKIGNRYSMTIQAEYKVIEPVTKTTLEKDGFIFPVTTRTEPTFMFP